MAKEGTRYNEQDDIVHIRQHVTRALGNYPHTTGAREILDNACDEVIRGHATKVDLIYHDDGSIEVRDNGRGLEIAFYSKRNKNSIVASIGSSRAGESFTTDTTTAGTHGEGAAATNAISQRMDVTVFKDGKKYVQQFRQGRPGKFTGNSFDPWAEFERKEGERLSARKITEKDAPKSGTWIRFYFDPTIAAHDEVDKDELNKRARMVAWLNSKMVLTITNEQGETETVNTKTRGTAGVLKQAAGLDSIATFDGDFDYEIKDKSGNVLSTKKVTYEVSIAPSLDATPISVANNVYTMDGGQHADAALRALGNAASEKSLRSLKRNVGESYPTAADFQSSIAVAVSVKLPQPSFAGQDKRRLAEPAAFTNRMVKDLERRVSIWANSPANSKALLSWAQLALDYARTQQKISAARKSIKLHTGTAAKGSNLSLPDKYTPCRVTGPGTGAELFIGEGQSAVNTIKAGRYASFQACFELKGKPRNVRKTTLTKLRANDEFTSIEALMGTGIGSHCDTSQRRFDRVIFSCDADVDGYNINSLLSCMFITYYTDYVREGRVFIAVPPLFIVTSNNPSDRIMCVDEQDRDQAVAELRKLGRKKIEVQRCKGLGEMNAGDFRETVLDPSKRTLVQLQYDPELDDPDLDIVFSGKAEDRRDWMHEVSKLGTFDRDDVME